MRSGGVRSGFGDDLTIALSGHLASLSKLRDSSVLVTGGTGFIGAWLAEAITFLNDQHGFDIRLVLQSPHASRLGERHPHLSRRPDIELLDTDARNIHELPGHVKWVVHAAASPDGRQHASDPTRTIETIVGGTTALMKAAARSAELQKVLNLSSGHIYGRQPLDMERMPETFIGGLDPASFTAAYAEAKRVAETICAAYGSQYRVPVTTARPFAFVGPYQLLDRPWAVNNFVRDATIGGNLRIHGDGLTVRSYMYPADMAAWLLVMLVDGEDGAAYNVGHPNGITLLELAEKIVRLAPRPVKIETDVLPEGRGSHSRFVPDVSKAQHKLHLSINFELETALQRMMAWAATSLRVSA
ncbi:MAG: NAD-dependent epimerase/dehydratase family protein [Fimbriimonadaceae bacterium]